MINLREEFDITDIRTIGNGSYSNVFGFIMYTRAHAYIAEVLSNQNFWNELDEISGPNWPIFAVRPHLVDPNANKKYTEYFSLDYRKDLPCFIAFQFNDDESIEHVSLKLSNETLDKAFGSIREIVKVITNAEDRILPEYKHTNGVFMNVKLDIEAYEVRKKIIDNMKYVPFIKDLLLNLIGVNRH